VKKSILYVPVLLTVISWPMKSGADEFFQYKEGTLSFPDLVATEELMGSKKYTSYVNLLNQKKCDKALSLLNQAFVGFYPQFARASENSGSQYIEWRAHVVYHIYPAVYLCDALQRLEERELQVKELGASPGFYQRGKSRQKGDPDGYMPHWFFRDLLLMGITGLAGNGYHPALPEIARLYRRGGLFEAGPEAEYYLLKRACHFGVKCKELAPRIGELEKLMPVDVQKDMIDRAMRKEFDFKAVALD
jgi:hypothetical protein